MSAAGPSGMRPEHLRELVAVRDRRVANALLAAIGRFVEAAATGALCDAARWILESRVIFLRKKTGPAPRPIRVGELWRRVIGKRLVDDNREKVNRICLSLRQFGVAVPGGAEALIHFRTLLEQALGEHGSAMCMIDVDFQNAFPSFEWDAIRKAADTQLPEISAWTRWCHASASQITLPCGEQLSVDRGIEQGDPFGPIYCALCIAEIMSRTRTRLEREGVHFFDAWFLDDGQLICRPDHADRVLRALDLETA